MMGRYLVCHPGAVWAVHDVHTGLVAGLKAQGHTVTEYALSGRLEASRVTLEYLWRKQVRRAGPLAGVRPSHADVQYLAGQEVVTRALRDDVDWVLVICAAYLHPDVLVLCRRARLPLAAVFTESPYDDPEQAKVAPLFDVVFTNERASVDVLRKANPNTHYLPMGYDPAQHGPGMTGEAPAHDVVFVGTGFDSRVALLSEVDWTGTDLGLYGYWADLPKGHPLRPYVHDGLVDNATAGALYRRAKIGLNLYRQPGTWSRAESMNPRAYELAADGVFTIAQPRKEQGERFGHAVEAFNGAAELQARVRDSLLDESWRLRASSALPSLVRDDTYHHRAATLVAHLS
jgi:spore maturation protein CgeB